jgi:UDP-GlcNAc:undecaprenyl-phosphate GlcNAc-1-phosphate transferase
VTAGGVGVIAGVHGEPVLGALALGLCGACVGFLPYNLASPRASIFLGDGGAMAIGFVIAAATMALPLESGEALLAAPVLVAVVLTDTALVIVSRSRRRVSVLTAGRDHLTHRLLARLRSPRLVVLALGGVQALLSGLAAVALELGRVVAVSAFSVALALALATIVILERGSAYPEQAVEALPAPPGSLESVQAETP